MGKMRTAFVASLFRRYREYSCSAAGWAEIFLVAGVTAAGACFMRKIAVFKGVTVAAVAAIRGNDSFAVTGGTVLRHFPSPPLYAILY